VHSKRDVRVRDEPTRLLLADPQVLVLEALRAFLPRDYRVVGCVRDGPKLVSEALRLEPDLVVSEVRLPGLDGIEAARRIRVARPWARIVFLTPLEDEALAAEAFAAGAAGYVLKSSTGAEFVAALRGVMRGERVLSRRIALGRPEGLRHGARACRCGSRLSPRASEVVRLLALGHSMKQAAYELGITPRTVAYHKYGAMHALGIGSSAELVRFAVNAGILEPPLAHEGPA
jgi:DNA-binding NarL/FixJ family response regulator